MMLSWSSSLAMAAFLYAPVCALAAEIKVVHPDGLPLSEILKGGCTIELQGEIEHGDSGRIEELFGGDTLRPVGITGFIDEDIFEMGEASHSLCLNSDGGDFDEALRILQTNAMNLYRVVTVVPNGYKCLSACALIFLGGTVMTSNSDGGNTLPVRVLSTGGIVGFHSPILDDVEKIPRILPRAAVIEFFSTGMDAVRRLNNVFTNQYYDTHGPVDRIPMDLLVELLSFVEIDTYFEISTINDAGRFDIFLADVPEIVVSREGFARFCVNSSIWNYSLIDSESADILSWGYTVYVSGNVTSIDSRHYRCDVRYIGSRYGDDYEVTFVDRQGVEQSRYMDAWESLPFYVPIKSLAGYSRVTDEFEPIYNYIHPLELDQSSPGPEILMDTVSIIRAGEGESFGRFSLSLLDDGAFTIWGEELGEFYGLYEILSRENLCLEFLKSDISELTGQKICGGISEGELRFDGYGNLSGLVEFQRKIN